MATSTTIRRASFFLILFMLAGGCIIGDQITTITVHPDGAADLVMFRSNLHSTETGDSAQRELAEYQATFKARTEQSFTHIQDAGGEIVDAGWLSQEPPAANYIYARLPNSTALEKYLTLNPDDGVELATQFRKEGSRRMLTFELTVPADKAQASHTSPTDMSQLKQMRANGLSETRFAVASGSITDARGFTVAEDNQSALLDTTALDHVFQTGGSAELYLEWQVTR